MMRFKTKTLTLVSLLLSLFFLCDFVPILFWGTFFFSLFLAVLAIHVGLLRVVALEASMILFDFMVNNPVRFVTSVFPSLENTVFLGVFMYFFIVGMSLLEIGFFRILSRRSLPKHFRLGY
jgi:hypothetical protein